MRRQTTPITLAFLLVLAATPAIADTTITYQGQLQDGGEPFVGAADMSFTLHEHTTDDLPIGPTIPLTQVAVSDGLFSVELDFGEVFTGQPLWLEASVDGTPLTPRQRITAVPMALNVPAGAGSNWQRVDGDLYFDTGNVGIGLDSPSAELQVAGNVVSGEPGNKAYGMNGFVSGGRTLQGVLSNNVTYGVASFVGGGYDNTASNYGSFVGGGMENSSSGQGSFVGGGYQNEASALNSFIGGGAVNTVDGALSFVGGGAHNQITSAGSFIGAGDSNIAAGDGSFIGGGSKNEASGFLSFVAGGLENTAAGNFSMAAGRRATASHDGTFVWADNTDENLESTGDNQFLIRAAGGVGIGSSNPNRDLHIKQRSTDNGSIGLQIERSGASTNNWAFYIATSDNLGFRYNDTLVARIDTSGQFTTLSDARFKTDIGPIENPLHRVLSLQPAQYRMQSGASDGELSLGLIAQQVRDVIPSAVSDSDDTLGIRYNQITALNTAAIIELHAAMKDDRDRMTELQAENETLRQRLAERPIGDEEIQAVVERNDELAQRLLVLEALLIGETRMSNHAKSATTP
ncbi:tail fiber domain-containing protein [Wenzhouxiangella sp. EGI_FJ10305]|uniref:tail fiber domain-containing protein n=1 Tax=Wenzhouxiangella sp. EGI_FJ10305 TaxID=3243768 RepID=UPI0035D9A99E